MLQQDEPDDFIIATGEQHSVREFIEVSANRLGIKIKWQGSKEDEIGINADNNKVIVRIDPRYYRPIISGVYSNYDFIIISIYSDLVLFRSLPFNFYPKSIC